MIDKLRLVARVVPLANPYIIGAGSSPTKHRPNITGAEIPLPVDSAVVLAHEAFPDVMMHKGEVLADLSGSEHEGLAAGDLLQRFTELRYTIEFAVASRPAGGVIARGDWICTR